MNLFHALYTRWRLRRFASVGPGVRLTGRVYLRGKGKCHLGANVCFEGSQAPIEIHVGPHASVTIGEGSVIGSGTSIEAQQSITIGSHARLQPFCKLLDNHFHQVVGDRHQKPKSNPLRIESCAVVGAFSVLLPGAAIAASARVPPRSVISRPFGQKPEVQR